MICSSCCTALSASATPPICQTSRQLLQLRMTSHQVFLLNIASQADRTVSRVCALAIGLLCSDMFNCSFSCSCEDAAGSPFRCAGVGEMATLMRARASPLIRQLLIGNFEAFTQIFTAAILQVRCSITSTVLYMRLQVMSA